MLRRNLLEDQPETATTRLDVLPVLPGLLHYFTFKSLALRMCLVRTLLVTLSVARLTQAREHTSFRLNLETVLKM